jgi:hypothetical protein
MPPHPCSGAGNAAQIFQRTFGSQKYAGGVPVGFLILRIVTCSLTAIIKSLTEELGIRSGIVLAPSLSLDLGFLGWGSGWILGALGQ